MENGSAIRGLARTSGILGSLCCAVWLTGCSAETANGLADLYDPTRAGGQTGSLQCGVVSLAQHYMLPDGRVQIVVGGGDCFDPTASGSLVLLGPDGEAVDHDVVVAAGDTAVVVVEVNSEDAAEDFTVRVAGQPDQPVKSQPAPALPTMVGELSWVSPPDCAPEFELVVDPTLVPYQERTRLDVSVDGGPAQVWLAAGAWSLDSDGNVSMRLPAVVAGYPENGEHLIEVSAIVEGEDASIAPTTTFFETQCPGADGGCTASGEGQPPHATPWTALALLLGALFRRRSAPS